MSQVLPAIALFLLLISTLKAQHAAQESVVPLHNFPVEQRFETVSGNPGKTSAPFVIRIHAERGYIIMPHTHVIDENIVVLKGTWMLGTGDRFNRKVLQSMEVGTYGFVPARMAHFAWSKTDTVLQVHGIGPFTTTWLTPIYELTSKGVLLETSAALPGTPTNSNPDGCFGVKLGARVPGGIVIAAQCTPGQLTQYRIQKPSGERFWVTQQELKIP